MIQFPDLRQGVRIVILIMLHLSFGILYNTSIFFSRQFLLEECEKENCLFFPNLCIFFCFRMNTVNFEIIRKAFYQLLLY